MKQILLTHEERGDRLTNRCIKLVEEPNLLQLAAWRDEVSLDIRYCGKYDMRTRRHEDGFEFDLILEKSPRDNRFAYDIRVTNLLFVKQLPLTEEELKLGWVRPDNVVGSYAIYHKHKRDNHKHSNGAEENYKCGKFGHLYRPKAFDADGRWTWCDMNIEGEQLVITAPEDFLQSARYPVRIDPIIGYDEMGASTYYPDCYSNNDYSKIFIIACVPGFVSENQVLESISGYTWTYNNPGWPETEDRFKMGVYTRGDDSDGHDWYHVADSDSYPYLTYNDPQWHDKPMTGNLLAGTTYVVALQGYSEDCGFLQGRIRWAGDARPGGSPMSRRHDNGASMNWPNTLHWQVLATFQQMHSLYVTYTDPPTTGKLELVTGWKIGEVTINDNAFTAELRSRAQFLQQNIVNLYTPQCRADLGDAQCGIDLEDSAGTYRHDGAVTSVSEDRYEFTDTSVPSYAAGDVFTGGKITWSIPQSADSYTGNNAGFSMEVKKYDPSTQKFELFHPMPYDIEVDDEFTVTWGCDKSIATCKNTFDNIVNFRGEPYVPNYDAIKRGRM